MEYVMIFKLCPKTPIILHPSIYGPGSAHAATLGQSRLIAEIRYLQ